MAKIRSEQFGERSIIHIIHRGTRGSEIVLDEKDRWHFLQAIYFLNDKTVDRNWKQDLNSKLRRSDLLSFEQKREIVSKWNKSGKRDTYIDIMAYCLMPNHFHLLVYVKDPKDVGKFMQRLSTSLAMRFNKKYGTKGGLFESRYKTSVIQNDLHFDIVLPYIIYKNPCELFHGGIKRAIRKQNDAFDFVSGYEFCSLGDFIKNRPQSAIISKNKLYENFEIPKSQQATKKWCTEYLKERPDIKSDTDYVLE